MKWQRIAPLFQGAKDTFGTLKIRADKDGFFEIPSLPAEPLGAVARHISGEAEVKSGFPEPLLAAAE